MIRLDDVRIPVADGVELSAMVHLPEGPGPTPALLSYSPYRKDDMLGVAFERHTDEYFAARGYAAVTVDLRGHGGSDGQALGAAHDQDGRDGAALVEWIGAQEWCDGNVGMWGCSYPGITALKTAAERPKHLKAIVPMMATLDLGSNWVHPGGCRNMLGATGVWGSFMIATRLMPPLYLDPEGDSWRRWQERLDSAEDPYLLEWQKHPERDRYWDEKAVDPGDVEVPALFIGGWRDIFPAGMIEAFEGAAGPRRLIFGPWTHGHPQEAAFEPIDHLAEMLAWWDRWLRGSEAAEEPDDPSAVRFYSQGEDRWLQSSSWPPAGVADRPLWLGPGATLSANPAEASEERVHTVDPTTGTAAGLWDPLGLDVGLPLDQGQDDLGSLAFTGEPLEEPLRLAGTPRATLRVEVEDGADLHLVAKLTDVSPDGRSALISTGWLKVEGGGSECELALNPTAYQLARGHRLRLSVSGADFPRIWPTRMNPTFRLACGSEAGSRISLPVLRDCEGSELQPPPASSGESDLIIDGEPRWRIERDEVAGEVAVATGFRLLFDTPSASARVEVDHTGRASVRRSRPDGATVRGETTLKAVTALGSEVEVRASTLVTQDAVSARARVRVAGVELLDRTWRGARGSR